MMSRDELISKAYKTVRDATVCSGELSTADQIAVLEQVKYEILRDNQISIDSDG